MATKAKPANKAQQDLNRWCIEMAIKWPLITTYNSPMQGVYSAGGGLGHQQTDADIIGRANKIMAWVKEAH